jgi:putrescine aminotransferase
VVAALRQYAGKAGRLMGEAPRNAAAAGALPQRPAADRRATVDALRRHVNAGMARVFSLSDSPLETRSQGSLVYDESDRAYLDCGGYCVFLLGHRHPRVTEAVARALANHPLSTRLLVDPTLAAAASALAEVAPPGLQYVWFGSAGAEVVDAAVKLCRANGCDTMVVADGAFHGKTIGALSVSGRRRYREPFEPLLPGVSRVPFDDLDALERALATHTGRTTPAGRPGRCAVLVEPVQSEGGVQVPADGYLAGIRALADRYRALFVLDEISTGLGRLGSWWGVSRDGVAPDIMLAGKALGGGVMPVAALLATPEVFEPFNRDPLLHTSTFSGNPLACAAVQATVDTIRDLGVVATAARLGDELLAALTDAVTLRRPWFVTEIRGRGLLLGVECAEEHLAAELMLELLHRRVLTSHSMNAHRVLRVTPPATLTSAEVQWLVGAFDEALVAVAARYRPPRGEGRDRATNGADDGQGAASRA